MYFYLFFCYFYEDISFCKLLCNSRGNKVYVYVGKLATGKFKLNYTYHHRMLTRV